jgi:hypothetical protein
VSFDPWDTAGPGGSGASTTRVAVGERTFSKTLYDRARKRLGDVERTGGRTFVVAGNDKLGDTYPHYGVRWKGGVEYECDCYSLNHGENRARRTCSHVLAVMIYRSELGRVGTIANGGNGKGAEGTATPPITSRSTSETQSTTVPVHDAAQHERVEEPVREDSNSSNGTTTMASGNAIGNGELSNVPAVSDSRFVEWDVTPLPEKFVEIRPHQWDAIGEVVEQFQSGVECVFVDAPTGSRVRV